MAVEHKLKLTKTENNSAIGHQKKTLDLYFYDTFTTFSKAWWQEFSNDDKN